MISRKVKRRRRVAGKRPLVAGVPAPHEAGVHD
jgi:hypothetical protein